MLNHVSYHSAAAKDSSVASARFLKISASRTTKPKFCYSRIQTKIISGYRGEQRECQIVIGRERVIRTKEIIFFYQS